MGKNDAKNAIASLVLMLAVGCMLAISGIYALQGKSAGSACTGDGTGTFVYGKWHVWRNGWVKD